MTFPRAFQNSTILPDGNVLVTGGGTALDGYDVSKGVLTAELWSPTTETWQTLSSAAFARLYHSTALLLPDARVLIAGSGQDGPAVNQTRAEIFSPPYLFKGARPSIGGMPSLVQYGDVLYGSDAGCCVDRLDRPDSTGRGHARVRRGSALPEPGLLGRSRKPHRSGAGERESGAAWLLHALSREHGWCAVRREFRAIAGSVVGYAATDTARQSAGPGRTRNGLADLGRGNGQHRSVDLQHSSRHDVGIRSVACESRRTVDEHVVCKWRRCGRNVLLRRDGSRRGGERERAVE